MQVVTWNVNSIRSRLARVSAWLARRRPDVVCFQETKVVDADFPRAPFEALGYRVETFGEKTYNGVAILSRRELTAVVRGFPGAGPDDPKRLIAADIDSVRCINVYVPNGSPLGSEKFAFKLAWLERLRSFLESSCDPEGDLVLCGDMNIAPEDRDVHDPEAWRGQVLFHPDEHAALARVRRWGLVDVLRARSTGRGPWTWWDYRAGAFGRDQGLRIDLVLATGSLAGRCSGVFVDRRERAGEGASDHAPVVTSFEERA